MATTPSDRDKLTTRITVDSRLLDAAQELKINVSLAAEAGLARAVAELRAQNWLQANEEALESSNAYVAVHGLPLARFRNF